MSNYIIKSDNMQKRNLQSDTTISSNDQSSTTDQDIPQNENLMRQFQSVINNAIPVIAQTVITVLQQNGCIPKTSNTAASTTCTEVTNGRDSSVHLPRSQTEYTSAVSNSVTSVGTNSANNGNFISTAMATNDFANVNVVDNLLQTGTYNNLQTTCSNDMSKKVGLARHLSLGVDSKIKAQIWANEYIEFETLLKLENQKTKFVPEERGPNNFY